MVPFRAKEPAKSAHSYFSSRKQLIPPKRKPKQHLLDSLPSVTGTQFEVCLFQLREQILKKLAADSFYYSEISKDRQPTVVVRERERENMEKEKILFAVVPVLQQQ